MKIRYPSETRDRVPICDHAILENSPEMAAGTNRSKPPTSICTAADMLFDSGNRRRLVHREPNAHTVAERSTSAALKGSERFAAEPCHVRTTTPASPVNAPATAPPVKDITLKTNASNTMTQSCIVANSTAASPEETRCSAQNSRP